MKVTRELIRKILEEKFFRDDFRDVYATARMAHVGQKRRSGEDYFTHPAEVRNIVNRFYPKDRISQLAALLHDTLEDAPGSTVDSVEEMEGFIRGSITDPRAATEVIRVVRALTHEKGGDYLSYVVSLIGDQPALRVKLADMVHNLSSSPSQKQKDKYRSAIDAISKSTGGAPPPGISKEHWSRLYSLTENKMKITKRQLRRIIREAFYGDEWGDTPSKKDPKRPWGSYSQAGDGSYEDTIMMSPNGDSVLVDGMETYIWDVPQQLEHVSGFPMGDAEGESLVNTLENQMQSGYVEISVTYENGKWSW